MTNNPEEIHEDFDGRKFYYWDFNMNQEYYSRDCGQNTTCEDYFDKYVRRVYIEEKLSKSSDDIDLGIYFTSDDEKLKYYKTYNIELEIDAVKLGEDIRVSLESKDYSYEVTELYSLIDEVIKLSETQYNNMSNIVSYIEHYKLSKKLKHKFFVATYSVLEKHIELARKSNNGLFELLINYITMYNQIEKLSDKIEDLSYRQKIKINKKFKEYNDILKILFFYDYNDFLTVGYNDFIRLLKKAKYKLKSVI